MKISNAPGRPSATSTGEIAMMITKFIARYSWAAILGALLANSGFMLQAWQYWAWFIPMLIAITAHDWAVKS